MAMQLMTRNELAAKYNCHRKTLRKFLLQAGIPDRVRLTEGHYAALERVMQQQPTTATTPVPPTSPMAFV